MRTANELRKALEGNLPCNIHYIKKDESSRQLICTRNMELVEKNFGKEFLPKGGNFNIKNDNIVRVFDVMNKGWRSFDIKRVSSWEIDYAYNQDQM